MTLDDPFARTPAPSAVSPQGDPHSQQIEGRTPDWQRNTLRDKGRKKVDCRRRGFVESYGLKGYYHEPSHEGLPGRRQFESPEATKSISGPAVVGGNNTYYLRRSGTSEQDELGYRRCRRATSPPSLKDRQERRRFIKTPQKPPPDGAECPHDPQPPPPQEQVGPEVPIPRLGHHNGWNCLRESDREMEFERVLGRKVRLDYQSLKSTGYAGDLTNTYGAAKRSEDDPTFFRIAVESPTFVRFMTNLPANSETSPHKRREMWFRQREESQRLEDAKLVESLGMRGEDEQENTAKEG
ncbi:hypothetical protein BSKO_08887 [Bryopsis sp. KO-2023]|nr:hypothetical protein BSKO_08887 [Bryopsis sp. KO-2023]